MTKLAPKQSQLDYLWENFGERGVATSSSDDPNSIPSYELIQKLLEDLCAKAVGSVTQSENTIIVKNVNGKEQNRINIGELGDGFSISGFGRRKVTQEDKDKECPYPIDSYIYYLRLSNGTEYAAPTNVYTGGSTKIISNTILDDTIYSDLKISTKVKGVIFSKESDGLSGSVYLENSSQGLRFSVVTQDQYDNIVKDATTLYFIKKSPYMYFGETRIGGDSLSDFAEIERRLTTVENLINWEENG